MRSQREKAGVLRSLHSSGDLLVLPNIWNPVGARVLAAKGYPAVATACAALSASLGYEDGEKIKRSTLVDCLERIARSVDVPMTTDIETGYGESLSELEETVDQVIEAGIVGINIEDSFEEGSSLRSIVEQCRRITVVRQVADRRNLHLVINARIDCFLSNSFPSKTDAINEAIVRAEAYLKAGADCVYPIGPGDEETARLLRSRIQAPINILASPNAAPLSTLREIGVNRVSFGPFIFRTCLKQFVEIVESIHAEGTYHACFNNMLSGQEVAQYLIDESE
jgi:2-methylisocitrate lyase-like PEP mutase family enzyme